MPNYTIQNQYLKVGVASKGAELQEIYSLTTNLHYLWSGDANFWGKKSPILFPIVGGLKNNEYTYKGQTYKLTRHGFARDMEFELVQQDEHSLVLKLSHSNETLKLYPFKFDLLVNYTVEKNTIRCTYNVINTDENEDMLFSIGAHPAFHVPLLCTTKFGDWHLQFSQQENAPIYPLTNEGLIKQNAIPFLQNAQHLSLKKELFYTDALVFKQLKSNEIKLQSEIAENGFTFRFSQFPYFGIWAAKDAPFVCLEPWCGIADNEHTSGKLEEKEGIISLAASKIFSQFWEVEVY